MGGEFLETGIIDEIKELPTSDGGKGWPVTVRDRIAYPINNDINIANVAVTFLWTMRDVIVPKLERENLAIATNFYTPSGLEGMIRNILSNPFIRYIILVGEEYSTSKEGKDLTSANAIRTFFQKGITEERKVPGFEQSIYFDKNIPIELINKVRDNVELIDINKEMQNSTYSEKIERINQLLKTLPKKLPFLEKPLTFDYEKPTGEFPYEGGPLIVKGNTIPETWIEIMHNIYRFGKKNLMDANTDRWVKEINNLIAVIHDPQNTDLSLNPFLVPLTMEKIKAYQDEVLSPELPKDKAYTYGNKLRAYLFNSPDYIKDLVNTKEYKNFEFGKGEHMDKNVKYLGNISEIDQIQDMIDVLSRNLYIKSCVGITWHVQDELMRKHKSSPCLVLIQAIVQDEKLNLTTFWRSHDMVQGWPENAYGMAAIQKKIADSINVDTGILTLISCSAQIYNNYYNQVEEMLGKYRKKQLLFHDPRGNYIIKIKNEKIVVTHINPITNRDMDIIEGTNAKEVYLKISERGDFDISHALYIGSELGKAETALKNNLEYIQDRPLKINPHNHSN
ncbi:DUF4346 domain-containing protein [Candidatus Woesearchaeota archaeon]|nr:DUF4346 domain-containing protein [Candidatus Woesearchaeota archaeon]